MLIDVGGRRLALECAGEGSPTVVLEAGLDCPAALWDPIWPQVQQMARVCRYDRANLGGSDPAPGPRTADQLVADLEALLRAAGIPGPYVLVGHSFGGLLTRLYAHRHRSQVAGLVLIESSHPEQKARMLGLLPPPEPGEPEALAAVRQYYSTPDAAGPEGVPADRIQQAAGQAGQLGDLPLTVLSRSWPADEAELAKRRPGLPREAAVAMEEQWQAMQQELAGLSTCSTHTVADSGGHFLHHDRPELVVAAIRQMVERVRGV